MILLLLKTRNSQTILQYMINSTKLLPGHLTQLTNDSLLGYLQHFNEIKTYQQINQGRQLLKLFSQSDSETACEKNIKNIVKYMKHSLPQGKVCIIQFCKQLIEIKNVKIFTELYKIFPPIFTNVCEYRSQIKDMNRGSTFFMNRQNLNQAADKFNQLLKLSNTYFRMTHEMLYIWSQFYFPASGYKQLYQQLSKKCTFPVYPNEFRFYNEAKVTKVAKVLVSFNQQIGTMNVSRQKQKDHNPKSTKLEPKKQHPSNEEQEKEIDILKLAAQESQISKIMIPSQKIKPQKPKRTEIPPNVVYRESSIEDPEDMTPKIKHLDSQMNFPLKKTHLEMPLDSIQQRTGQNQTQVDSRHVTNQKILSSQNRQSLEDQNISSSISTERRIFESQGDSEKQKQINREQLHNGDRSKITIEAITDDFLGELQNSVPIKPHSKKSTINNNPNKKDKQKEIQLIGSNYTIQQMSILQRQQQEPQHTLSSLLRKQKEVLPSQKTVRENKQTIKKKKDIQETSMDSQPKEKPNFKSSLDNQIVNKGLTQKEAMIEVLNSEVEQGKRKDQNAIKKQNFRKFKEYSLTIVPPQSQEIHPEQNKLQQSQIVIKEMSDNLNQLLAQFSQYTKEAKVSSEQTSKQLKQLINKHQVKEIIGESMKQSIYGEQVSLMDQLKEQYALSKKDSLLSHENKIKSRLCKTLKDFEKQQSAVVKTIGLDKLTITDKFERATIRSNSEKRSVLRKKRTSVQLFEYGEGTMLHLLANKKKSLML